VKLNLIERFTISVRVLCILIGRSCLKSPSNTLYVEIPRYYTFKKEKINGRNISRWVKRKSHYNCIGRMYSVSLTHTTYNT